VEVDFVEVFLLEWAWSVNVRKLPLKVGHNRLDELLSVLAHLKFNNILKLNRSLKQKLWNQRNKKIENLLFLA
jgi:hypothetical protein